MQAKQASLRAGEQNLVERLHALKLEESRLQSVATQQQQEKEAIEPARQELSNQEAKARQQLADGRQESARQQHEAGQQQAAIEAARQELETRQRQEAARERSGSDLFSVGDRAAGKKRKTSVEPEAATSTTATDETQRWALAS